MRTLLVDHQTAFARAVQGARVDCGFAIDVRRTLDEAAAALDRACYDMLLLELALPDGDGLDWLKQLRRSGKSMPAMVISGLDDLDRRIASFNGGADDFLSKPLPTVELIARMRAILRRSKQMTAPLYSGMSNSIRLPGKPGLMGRRSASRGVNCAFLSICSAMQGARCRAPHWRIAFIRSTMRSRPMRLRRHSIVCADI